MLRFLTIAAFSLATPTFAEETETHSPSSWILTPQVSIVVPETIEFADGAHRTLFTENFRGAPTFGVGLGKVLKASDRSQWLAFARLMYSYKEGSYKTLYSSGDEAQEKLQLHWVPLSSGLQYQFSWEELPFLKPSLSLSGGVHWLYSRGPASHSYWVPFIAVSPMLTFFEGQHEKDWFGGFGFGITYAHSISPQHKLNSWAFDLSLNFLL